jgi:hypothetical protein
LRVDRKDTRVRVGDNRLTIRWRWRDDRLGDGRAGRGVRGGDPRGARSDRLTREQIIPFRRSAILAQQLRTSPEPGDARVDSFEAAICRRKRKSWIHVTRDTFAAENLAPAASSSTSSRSPGSCCAARKPIAAARQPLERD